MEDRTPEVHVVHPPGGSMYAMVFGNGAEGQYLLAALGFTSLRQIGRYRDAWIERSPDGLPWIAVYTRLGGANREDYAEVIEGLQDNEFYLVDRDDGFDNTYATFYFRMPDDLMTLFDETYPTWRDEVQDPVDMDEMWKRAIEALR